MPCLSWQSGEIFSKAVSFFLWRLYICVSHMLMRNENVYLYLCCWIKACHNDTQAIICIRATVKHINLVLLWQRRDKHQGKTLYEKKCKDAVTKNAITTIRKSFADNLKTCALMCWNKYTVYSKACISAWYFSIGTWSWIKYLHKDVNPMIPFHLK